MFNFDNGSSYKNKQMELLAARIGSVVHYDQPYTPTQKAKIERWFRTMKDQWMSEEEINAVFLLEIERRVSSDSVIVIDQIEYEVDFRFAKQRIRLRYSPDMKDIFIV